MKYSPLVPNLDGCLRLFGGMLRKGEPNRNFVSVSKTFRFIVRNWFPGICKCDQCHEKFYRSHDLDNDATLVTVLARRTCFVFEKNILLRHDFLLYDYFV